MIVQVILNGLMAGLTLGLVAVGFSLIYRTTRILHAAHAATYLAGAYTGILLIKHFHVPVAIAAIGAMLAAVALGVIVEVGVYRSLRKLNSSALIFLLSSLAVVVISQNVVGLTFGSEIQVSRSIEGSFQIGGGRITAWQAISSGVSIILFFVSWGLLRFTYLGRKIRAIATDPDLAEIVGVGKDSTFLFTVCIGSALSGVAGFLIGYDTAITPNMTFRILLVGVTAAIVGGIGSIPGAMVGGILIGVTQHIGTWKLPTQWQDAIVFFVLILFLLFRPQGFWGVPIRKAAM